MSRRKGSAKNPRRRIFVFLSDTHGGHKLGLLSPDTVFHDEDENGEIVPYHPSLSASQKYLWKIYEWCKDEIQKIAGPDDEIYIIHNGDLTQGDKYASSTEMTTESVAEQQLIAMANMGFLCTIPNVKWVRLVVGTQSHIFNHSSSPQLVNAVISRDYPDINMRVVHHGYIDVDGFVIDVAHHGPPPGSRSWLKGNVARYYLRDIMEKDLKAGRRPPNLVYRAHYHEPIEEMLSIFANGTQYKSSLLITPSFSLLGGYARQAVRSPSHIANGMAIVAVTKGEPTPQIHWRFKTTDVRTKERIRG